MFRALTVYILLSMAATCASTLVHACEKEHPPVVSRPVARFFARDTEGAEVLRLSIDPRGISGVLLANDPLGQWLQGDVWHYREWQWWRGHPWGDSCRPRFWTKAQFDVVRNPSSHATIAYRIDGFDTYQQFLPPKSVAANAPYWDLVITVHNVTGGDVEEYGQFFACYTDLNRDQSFWYWDQNGALALFAEKGVTHLDGYIAHPQAYFAGAGAIPHCPRGGGKLVGTWHRPVMVSHASSTGWRSVILLEEAYTASLAHGKRGGAMDYIIFPGPQQRTFANGAEFSVHLRHVLLHSPELPSRNMLQRLWTDFASAHITTRQHAARLLLRP